MGKIFRDIREAVVSIAIGMYFLGVPGALAIGVVNVIGAYIPYIGAFFGGGSGTILG